MPKRVSLVEGFDPAFRGPEDTRTLSPITTLVEEGGGGRVVPEL